MSSRPVLGLTMGDPAGIGPEICLRALGEPAILEQCVPVVFGDAGVLERVQSSSSSFSSSENSDSRTRTKAATGKFNVVSVREFEDAKSIEVPTIVDCAAIDTNKTQPGKISADCGRAAYVYIERAIQSAMDKKIAGVVTAPIHKEALRLAGVPHAGHTEIFTELTSAKRSCMMLWSDVLTVSMVTTHIGFTEVPARLSVERVLDVIELTAEVVERMSGKRPGLGICGLNPHAGEHGLFGRREEEEFIEPAIVRARESGIEVEGPLAPDAAFTPGQRKRFDAIVTLYHDQGHIPFKMLAFDTGVNITLGLPIIRTSVDHGTAFDIAWQGRADPRSLYSAISVAAKLASGNAQVGKPAVQQTGKSALRDLAGTESLGFSPTSHKS